MRNLKTKHKILIALLVVALGYLSYAYVDLRTELFTVYDVPDKYTYKTAPDADLIIVDFNRYGCEHCRDLHPVLLEAIRHDGKIIYIPRPVSFGDEWSATINAAVYAAGEQGKFIDLFNGIYENWPVDDLEALYKIAQSKGINVDKLAQDILNPDTIAWLNYNDEYFEAWGFNSIPVLLIGKKKIFRYGKTVPTVDEILDKFAQARQKW